MKTEHMTGCRFLLTRMYTLHTLRDNGEELAALKGMVGQHLEVASVWWENGEVAHIAVRQPCGVGVSTLFPGCAEGLIIFPGGHAVPFPNCADDPADRAANARDVAAWDK